MLWIKPEAIDIRAGFEVTMYFSIRWCITNRKFGQAFESPRLQE